MRKQGKSNAKSIIIQLLIAMPALTILFAILGAKLILSESIGQSQMELCACICTGAVSLMISLYCTLRMPQKKLLWGMSTAIGYLCLLFLGNLLFFGIGYGSIMPVSLSVIGAGLLGSILGSGKKKKYA